MSKRSRFRAADNHIHTDDLHLPDDRTEQSFVFIQEMTDCTDRADRLMTVRSWAHRVGIETRAPECVRRQETADRLAEKRSKRATLLTQDSSGGQSYWITLLKLDGDIVDLEEEMKS
jgi:hypothetical protein